MRNPRSDLARLLGAAAFAARKHSTQRRKDAEASPYINHPLALADVLANEGGVLDIEVLCAALLHDTIEDTDTSADELRAGFGAAIADIVLEVSDDKALPKQARKDLQVEHAATISPQAKLVKLADKICNLRDLVASPPAAQFFDFGYSGSIARKRRLYSEVRSLASCGFRMIVGVSRMMVSSRLVSDRC